MKLFKKKEKNAELEMIEKMHVEELADLKFQLYCERDRIESLELEEKRKQKIIEDFYERERIYQKRIKVLTNEIINKGDNKHE